MKLLSRLALILPLLSGVAFADGMSQLKAFLDGGQSASAVFTQTVVGKQKRQQSSGTFELQRPGKFRWEYLKPFPQLIVSDAKKVWVYDPDLEQVTERNLTRAIGDTPAALLAGSNELEKGFSLKPAASHDGLEWVTATPKDSESTFKQIELGFADSQLKRMVMQDQFGQTTTVDFSQIQRNPKLDPKRFEFTPPKGADIIKDKG